MKPGTKGYPQQKTKFGNFDTQTYEGAMKLCNMIKSYWAAQGKMVTAWPVLLPKCSAVHEARVWTIKSDITITNFDAPLPAIVERTEPINVKGYNSKPRKEAA